MTFKDLHNIIQVYNDSFERVKLETKEEIVRKTKTYTIKKLGAWLMAGKSSLLILNTLFKDDGKNSDIKRKKVENDICMYFMEAIVEKGLHKLCEEEREFNESMRRIDEEMIDKVANLPKNRLTKKW